MSRVAQKVLYIIVAVVVSMGLTALLLSQRPTLAADSAPAADAAKAGTVAGIVVSPHGPVAGARVRVQLTENLTTTTQAGTFTLEGMEAGHAVSVTAWANDHYIGAATAVGDGEPVTISLKPHYTTDNVEYDWFDFEEVEGSDACGVCHTANSEWELDAHAQAALNQRFLSLYAGTDVDGNKSPRTVFTLAGKVEPRDPSAEYYGPGFKLDYPDRAGNCATCHTPMAAKLPNTSNCGWSGCHTSTTAQYSEEVPDGVSPMYLDGDAAEGIACDFCHKIGDVAIKAETGLPYADMPGILSLRLYRPEEGEQLFFGPLDDVPRQDTYSPLQAKSEFCAGCHFGIFGGIVGAGQVTSGTVIYNSYGEWLESPYSEPETGKTCQDCHMPVVDAEYFVFPEQGGMQRPYGQIHNHRMPGASDRKLLQNAVTMTAAATLEEVQVVVDVSVTNDQAGHHVPTDVPLREVLLVVEAKDEDGKALVLAEGPSLPEWAGNYAGQAGKAYAKVLRDEWTGEAPTAAYWRPLELVEDTRLAAFATDASHFAFSAPESEIATVKVRLLFRRAPQQLMEQKGWNDPDIVMEQATLVVEAAPQQP